MRFQVRLLTLLAATAYLSVVFATLRVYGPTAFVGFCGILVTFLVYRNPDVARHRLVKTGAAWGAWGVFIASMFLPCMSGPFGYFFGYEAAFGAFKYPFRLASGEQMLSDWTAVELVSVILIDVANVILLLTPLWLLLLSIVIKSVERWEYVLAVMISVASPAVWMAALGLSPEVGFYFWAFSFVVLLPAIRMRAVHVVIMCIVFALMCLSK